MKPRTVLTLILTTALGLVGACGDDGGPTDPQLVFVKVSPDSARFVIGDAVVFSAEVVDDEGVVLPNRTMAVTWASTGAAIASVDAMGVVTGLSDGEASVIATSGDAADSAHVTVVALRFRSVVAGAHTCGVTPDGEAWCWGQGDKGALGHGRTDTTGIPVPVLGGLTFEQIAPGSWHTCGVAVGGAAYCWGVEDMLGIGLADTVSHFAPEAVSGGLLFESIVSGGGHTCGLTSGGLAHCWGWNDFGSLGVGDDQFTHYPTPQAVAGGLAFTQMSALGSTTCAVTTSGAVYCWGRDNAVGQIGIGAPDGDPHPEPDSVASTLTFESVSVGTSHACALTDQGAAYCWGHNGNGELGAATIEDCLGSPCSSAPISVSGGLTFRAIAAGLQFTCGVDTAGQAYCWGGFAGGIGGGNMAPTAVGSGIDFVTLSANHHVCGVSSDGLAYCWGHNWDGSVGNGELSGTVTIPTLVFGQG